MKDIWGDTLTEKNYTKRGLSGQGRAARIVASLACILAMLPTQPHGEHIGQRLQGDGRRNVHFAASSSKSTTRAASIHTGRMAVAVHGPAIPGPVRGLENVVALASSGTHSLALLPNGAVYAWGDNNVGQLGDGSLDSSEDPVRVSRLPRVVAVAAGANDSLALGADGAVYVWGDNGGGQLGNGSDDPNGSPVPVRVPSLRGVVAIAAGLTHNLALLRDGTARAWGANNSSSYDDPGAFQSGVPVPVRGLAGVAAIAGGDGYSLALKRDETVYAWGTNEFGDLGDGTTTGHLAPCGCAASPAWSPSRPVAVTIWPCCGTGLSVRGAMISAAN